MSDSKKTTDWERQGSGNSEERALIIHENLQVGDTGGGLKRD
jgi:hypothetical protein